MKNILTKWHLDITFYFFLFLSFLCGYFKQTLCIFFLVILHELGHIFMIKLFSYSLIKVEIFPFGGITTIEKPINSSINKDLFISLGGVFFEVLFWIFLLCFSSFLPKDVSFFLYHYNIILICFNLLPIIPLDGSKMMQAFLEKFFPYEKAFFLYEAISIFSFFLFFLGNILFSFDNYFICGVLFFQFLLLKKNEKYLKERFYLERYLYTFPYKKIKNETKKNYKVLKKETLHFFLEDKRYLHEKEFLKEKFQRKA